jgi:hypothetical protein
MKQVWEIILLLLAGGAASGLLVWIFNLVDGNGKKVKVQAAQLNLLEALSRKEFSDIFAQLGNCSEEALSLPFVQEKLKKYFRHYFRKLSDSWPKILETDQAIKDLPKKTGDIVKTIFLAFCFDISKEIGGITHTSSEIWGNTYAELIIQQDLTGKRFLEEIFSHANVTWQASAFQYAIAEIMKYANYSDDDWVALRPYFEAEIQNIKAKIENLNF